MSSVERLSTREILNRTNEVFLGHFGKLVVPVLVAGFAVLLTTYLGGVAQRSITAFAGPLFNGRPRSLIFAFIMPIGILQTLAVWGVRVLVWGFAFGLTAQMIIDRDYRAGKSLRTLATEHGWANLLWRLYLWLCLPGYVVIVANSWAALWLGRWLETHRWVPHLYYVSEAQSQLIRDGLIFLAFGLIYVTYARRFALAIPLPIAARDLPIDPLVESRRASRPWRVAIIASCLVVCGISILGEKDWPLLFGGRGMVHMTLIQAYVVWILVGLATSVPWAWLFVFLTEIAIAEGPAEAAVADADPGPVLIPSS